MYLPYNQTYSLLLKTDTGSIIEGTVNPLKDSTHTEETWEQLTESERRQWLDDYARDWALQYFEYSWLIKLQFKTNPAILKE